MTQNLYTSFAPTVYPDADERTKQHAGNAKAGDDYSYYKRRAAKMGHIKGQGWLESITLREA